MRTNIFLLVPAEAAEVPCLSRLVSKDWRRFRMSPCFFRFSALTRFSTNGVKVLFPLHFGSPQVHPAIL